MELTGLLLACIAEDEGLEFKYHSHASVFADRTQGDWTYEADNHNQVTLRYWRNPTTSFAEKVSNPVAVSNAEERKELQAALTQGVQNLKAKISQSS